MRRENPGAAEVSFQPCFEFLFPAAGHPGKNGTQHSSPRFNKSVPLSGHMPPSLENGAKADFPGCWEHRMRSYVRVHCKKQGTTCLLLSMPTTVASRRSKMKTLTPLACWHHDPKPLPQKHPGEKGLSQSRNATGEQPPLQIPFWAQSELALKPGIPMATSSLLFGPPTPYIALTPEKCCTEPAVPRAQPSPCTRVGKATEGPKSPREEREPPTQASPQLPHRPLPSFPGWGQGTGSLGNCRVPRTLTCGQSDIKENT